MDTTTKFALVIVALILLVGIPLRLRAGEPKAKRGGAISINRILRAIKTKENYQGKPGLKGELGELQWMPAAWREVSKLPFKTCLGITEVDRIEVHAAEVRWILLLMNRNQRLKQVLTPYNIALLHNAGYGAVRRHEVAASSREYAEQVENLYYATHP